jgi:hypothetical protein
VVDLSGKAARLVRWVRKIEKPKSRGADDGLMERAMPSDPGGRWKGA